VVPMTCEETRDLLAEYLLGSLDDVLTAKVDRHLRGCAACREELATLSDGVSALALATHDEVPPAELRDRVLGVLDDEWTDAGRSTSAPGDAAAPRHPSTVRRGWLVAVAAAVVVAIVALGWGGVAQRQASRAQAQAAEYDRFLGALGGEGVRVGSLASATDPSLEGSAVVYDSKVGQSWVMVLIRAPGLTGPLHATLATPSGSPISLRPLTLGPDGDGSTWLVTGKDLHPYDRVTVTDDTGTVVASGSVSDT
jgi:hypothetical protein